MRRVDRIVTAEMTIVRDDEEYEISVRGKYTASPGRMYGEWADCYPDEAETDLWEAWCDDNDEIGLDDLTQDERHKAETLIAETALDEERDCL